MDDPNKLACKQRSKFIFDILHRTHMLGWLRLINGNQSIQSRS